LSKLVKQGYKEVFGSPHWKHSELVFERKELIPALKQFLNSYLCSKVPAEMIFAAEELSSYNCKE